MRITDTRVVLHDDEKLRAFISITLDSAIVIRGLKVIRGNKGLFVAMPNRRRPDGSFQDVAHPIHRQAREWLEGTVLSAYKRALRLERGEEGESHDVDQDFAVDAPSRARPRVFDLPTR